MLLLFLQDVELLNPKEVHFFTPETGGLGRKVDLSFTVISKNVYK